MGMSFTNIDKGLAVYFLVDCSESVGIDVNKAVNAINSIVPDLQKVNQDYKKMDMKVRIIRFSDGASFASPASIPIDRFKANSLFASGSCELGKALELLYTKLNAPSVPEGVTPPVLVLISNGHPTDDYKKPLAALKALPMYKFAMRFGFAVGSNPDKDMLLEFVGLPTNVFGLDKIRTIPAAFDRGH